MSDPKQLQTAAANSGGDALKEFQLSELTISEKSSSEVGKKISQKIWGQVTSGFGGYFFNRNARFRKNRNWANGRIDVQTMFQDRFEMNGKKNYMRLVWQTLQLTNRICSGLVGRWMTRGEKIQVKAIDDLSQKNKQEEYDQIEFIIENRQKLEQLEAESGVQIIPRDKELPADKEELNLWQAQFQKIPEEIIQELGCNEVLSSNGWFDVLKEKMLHDSAEVGLVGTSVYTDSTGVIHIEWEKPENLIYSFSEYPDFRDTSWRGKIPSLKISELRRDFGKEFNPNNPLALTEQQLFTIAQTATEYKNYTNISWDASWNLQLLRPYDEWSVRAMFFWVKTVDTEPYTITTSKSTGTTYTQKGYPTTSSGKKRDKPSENQRIIEDTNWNIYEGVYLPDNDILLKWGLQKNMIRPQDPKEVGNAEFPISLYMYQNYEMRNLAIPEKIEAAIDGMILALLKIQQIVARLVPIGWAVDETKLNDIDYGLGDDNKSIDHAKVFFQTGMMYYKGTDAEGVRDPNPPIKELANNGFVGQMQGLIANYQFWYQTLKDELGEDPNLVTSALQPRVTSSNVEASQNQAEYATDYMYRAYSECMKITSRKISCLLKDSIMYGSIAYRNIIKEDISDSMFSTDIRFLPTEQEVMQFENIMNNALNATPELLQFLDPFQLIRVAKEDVKLSELLFRRAQKKMILYQQQVAKENQDATFKAQVESGKTSEIEKRKSMQIEVNTKGAIEMATSKEKQKEIVLQGIFSIYAKGLTIPTELKGLESEMIQNVALPLFSENMANAQAIRQGEQQAQEQDEQMQQQQAVQQQEQQQPQPEMAA